MKKNDPKLFQALAMPHLDRLLSAARRRLRSPELAEDVVQETYLQAWRHFGDLSNPTLVYPWMFGILRRQIADYYRLHARRHVLVPITRLDESYEAIVSGDDDQPFEALLESLAWQRLSDLLMQLPDDFCEALTLHDLEGFRYREIAEMTDAPLGTVMSRIHRARQMLLAMAGQPATRRDEISPGAAGREESKS